MEQAIFIFIKELSNSSVGDSKQEDLWELTMAGPATL